MYLQLFIEGRLRGEWYHDETEAFKKVQGSFKMNVQLHEEWLAIEKERIRQTYFYDILSASSWYIVLSVKSKINRYYNQAN